jgi:hypothetical protein
MNEPDGTRLLHQAADTTLLRCLTRCLHICRTTRQRKDLRNPWCVPSLAIPSVEEEVCDSKRRIGLRQIIYNRRTEKIDFRSCHRPNTEGETHHRTHLPPLTVESLNWIQMGEPLTLFLNPKNPRIFSPTQESLAFEEPRASVDFTCPIRRG